jgi:UDP-N-acetylmuramate--alanine ligase
VTVVDDYAHHPTEIRATLAAARAAFPGRRLVAVFQPHLYSRTRDFAEEFASALASADVVALTDIYPAREAPIPGVGMASISAPLRKLREQGVALELPKEKVVTEITAMARPGDVILMLGAGDIGDVARELWRRLEGKAKE